jgi:hypothetical protein
MLILVAVVGCVCVVTIGLLASGRPSPYGSVDERFANRSARRAVGTGLEGSAVAVSALPVPKDPPPPDFVARLPSEDDAERERNAMFRDRVRRAEQEARGFESDSMRLRRLERELEALKRGR